MKVPPKILMQINIPQVLHNNHFPFSSISTKNHSKQEDGKYGRAEQGPLGYIQKEPSGATIFNLDLLQEFNDKHLSNFLHGSHASSFSTSYTCHACTDYEICTSRIDEFLNIAVDSDCTSLYICHACTISEMTDSCIDEFLDIVVDSHAVHTNCTNTIDALDWIPHVDLMCEVVVYVLGAVLASYEFDFLPP
ncbi:hypothetical protein Lal_00033596 [Lupinus albus]|nr:hypothetical protein Lal_00033596 [Lupinus albus]